MKAALLTFEGNFVGSGTWNTTEVNWRNPSSVLVPWTNGNDAQFTDSGVVTVGADIVANSIALTNGMSFLGAAGSLQFNSLNLTASSSTSINVPIKGTAGFTKSGPGFLNLGATNPVSGNVVIAAGGIEIGTADALRNATVVVNSSNGLSLVPITTNLGGLGGNAPFLNVAQRKLVVGYNNADTTFSSQLIGNNPNVNEATFTKVGTGTMAITGDWSGFAGRRRVEGGLVGISNLSFFGNLLTLANGGGLRFDTNMTVGIGYNATVEGGVTFDTNGHNVSWLTNLGGNGNIVKRGAGTFEFPNSLFALKDLSVLGGTFSVNSMNNIDDNPSYVMTLDGGTFSTGSAGTDFIEFDRTIVGGSGGTFDIRSTSGVLRTRLITGPGGLTKTGDGKLLMPTQFAPNYQGKTDVLQGSLESQNLPDGTALTVAAGASVTLHKSAQTLGSLAGSGSLSFTNNLVELAVGTNNTSTTFGGTITGDVSLVKLGTGTLTLTGNGISARDVTVSGGTLLFSGNPAHTGLTTVNSGATLRGQIPSPSPLILNGGTADISVGTTVFIANVHSVAGSGGTLQIGRANLTLTSSASTAFSGNIVGSDSFASVTKSGSGTFTMNGNFQGIGQLIVNAGTLQTGTSGAAIPDSANVIVNAGATLRLGNADEAVGGIAGAGTIDFGSGAFRTLTILGRPARLGRRSVEVFRALAE